jgi:hypothetical protein
VPERRRRRSPNGSPAIFVNRAATHRGEGCLIWPHAIASNGYGRVWIDGVSHQAHRLVLELAAGPPPAPDLVAAHAPLVCHNRRCVNPAHLRWATRSENAVDTVLDGTAGKVRLPGSFNPASKLTESQVLAIRSDPRMGHVVAAEMGVSKQLVSRIRRRECWEHV